jgi:branched-chain amino acid transport system ATP-binding protein
MNIALRISQRIYVMCHGKMVFEGSPEALQNNTEVRKEWLEV